MNLDDLRVTAPLTLLPSVLEEVGLADRYSLHPTPAGDAWVAWNGEGISCIWWGEGEEEFREHFAVRFGRPLRRASPGDDLPVGRYDLRGIGEFQAAVLRKALEIPAGQVRPYSWIAAEIGRPKAVRAVGTALGRNPVPLFIPCHRVVRTDGIIGHYAFGTDRKRALLEAEGVDLDELASTRFVGSDSTHVVCYPTCVNARGITTGHRAEFRTLASAATAGYRPCTVCRPVAA